MRHGHGKLVYDDGSYYIGQWCLGKMNGLGILYYSNGQKAYEGSWKENKFNGQGLIYNENPIINQNQFDFKDFNFINQ